MSVSKIISRQVPTGNITSTEKCVHTHVRRNRHSENRTENGKTGRDPFYFALHSEKTNYHTKKRFENKGQTWIMTSFAISSNELLHDLRRAHVLYS